MELTVKRGLLTLVDKALLEDFVELSKSCGGAEYFLTFTEDKTRYVWVYPVKQKSEVFGRFLEWKAIAEKSSEHR